MAPALEIYNDSEFSSEPEEIKYIKSGTILV
jgi:hypothetical protein